MAKKTVEEIIAKYKEIVGERDDDEAIGFLEDLSDSYTVDTEDWKSKYEQNDKEWRQKYMDRFNAPKDDVDDVEEPFVRKDTFESLFKED